jgi:hypothetical protein
MSGLVYSSLKPFLYPDRLKAISAGAVPAPVHVRLKPTNVCNHDCDFCAYRCEGLSLGNLMDERDRIPRDKMLEIADDLVAMGVEAVTFSGGGEPLIYPYLVETVERLAAGGIAIGVLSNGSMLRSAAAEIARLAMRDAEQMQRLRPRRRRGQGAAIERSRLAGPPLPVQRKSTVEVGNGGILLERGLLAPAAGLNRTALADSGAFCPLAIKFSRGRSTAGAPAVPFDLHQGGVLPQP